MYDAAADAVLVATRSRRLSSTISVWPGRAPGGGGAVDRRRDLVLPAHPRETLASTVALYFDHNRVKDTPLVVERSKGPATLRM